MRNLWDQILPMPWSASYLTHSDKPKPPPAVSVPTRGFDRLDERC